MKLIYKRSLLAAGITLGSLWSTMGRTHAATFNWQGNTLTGTWNTVGGTGWDAGPPNAAGDVAQRVTPLTGDVDIAVTDNDVTVGSIKIGDGTADLGNFYFEIDPAAGKVLNLNNSGAGATVEWNNLSTGNAAQLWFGGAGSVNLQDNLKINVVPNLTGLTAAGGAIAFDVPITGTGNITINSNQAIPDFSISALGQVQSAVGLRKANSYVGTTTIEKGAVQFLTGTSFGASTNTIQLGVAGSDSAAVLSGGGIVMTLANPIIVGPSIGTNTGTLTIGYPSSSTSGIVTYSGSITLNSNLNVISNSTAASQIFTGNITGSGGVTFPTDFNNGRSNFRGTNTYAGDTVINGQTLVVRAFGPGDINSLAIPNGVGKGNVSVSAPGTLILVGNETINGLSGNGTINSTTFGSILTLGDNDANGTFSGSILPGNVGTAIAKIGSGTQVLSGTNTYAGATAINAGTLQFAMPASFYNSTAASWTPTNLVVNTGAVAVFNVGGASEFLTTDLDTIQAQINAASTATTGFTPGSSIGLDTTGGNFSYSTAIPDANGNSIGFVKSGANTLTLGGTNTYTGSTTVAGGTLEVSPTGSIDTSPAITVDSTGALLTNHILTTSLTINGTATINANGGTAGASKVETLIMGTGSQLNLKNNDLVFGTGSLTDVRAQIKLGLSGISNTAAASGITSDMMTFGVHGFGYASGSDPNLNPILGGSLSGQSYDADSVLVKFTYRGDADLDGDSDLDDLGYWANSFTGDLGLGPLASPTTLWTQGDWDYDGDTDLDDLGFWSSTFTGDLGGGGLSVYAPNAPDGAIAALAQMGIKAVPEPGTMSLIGIGFCMVGVLRRSARRGNLVNRK